MFQILVLVVSHDGIAQLVFEDTALDLTKEAMDWMKGYQEHLKGTGITTLLLATYIFYLVVFLTGHWNYRFIYLLFMYLIL